MTSLLLVAGAVLVVSCVAMLGWLHDKRAKRPRRARLFADEGIRRRAASTHRYYRDVRNSQDSGFG